LDSALVREQLLRQVEDGLQAALDAARRAGLQRDGLVQMGLIGANGARVAALVASVAVAIAADRRRMRYGRPNATTGPVGTGRPM
jgi:hypothetical protein